MTFKGDGSEDLKFLSESVDKKYYINNNRGSWSATNERAGKGFVATEYFPRHFLGEGELKLDWIFVANKGEFLRPAFAETMSDMFQALGPNFPSDHVPTTVLLNLPQ